MNDKYNILNLSTINELKEILEDDIFAIYDEFQTSTKKMLQDLKKAHEAGDSNAVLHLSHTIKGSCSNIGLQRIFEITRQIENGLRENTNPDIARLIQETESAYTATLAALKAEGLLP
ncbi:MAG: Hpt domain-containing protein [Gammaproteobacteria bacterium]|nr:Hpt domain-containing protein [Gammaproteobacteria bacterium]